MGTGQLAMGPEGMHAPVRAAGFRLRSQLKLAFKVINSRTVQTRD